MEDKLKKEFDKLDKDNNIRRWALEFLVIAYM